MQIQLFLSILQKYMLDVGSLSLASRWDCYNVTTTKRRMLPVVDVARVSVTIESNAHASDNCRNQLITCR